MKEVGRRFWCSWIMLLYLKLEQDERSNYPYSFSSHYPKFGTRTRELARVKNEAVRRATSIEFANIPKTSGLFPRIMQVTR